MSLPDSTAAAALEAEVIKPVFFAWLDIVGDEVRANSSGHDITPTGTGDPDFDDHLFIGVGAAFNDITGIKITDQGTEPVISSLSGIQELDTDTLNTVGDPVNWQGRMLRLWRMIRNASNVQQGGVQHLHLGYMTSLEISGDDSEQKISVSSETYLAAFSAAANRTYDQAPYDPDDLSYLAAPSITNGVSGANGNTPTGGGSGGGNYGGGKLNFGEAFR